MGDHTAPKAATVNPQVPMTTLIRYWVTGSAAGMQIAEEAPRIQMQHPRLLHHPPGLPLRRPDTRRWPTWIGTPQTLSLATHPPQPTPTAFGHDESTMKRVQAHAMNARVVGVVLRITRLTD